MSAGLGENSSRELFQAAGPAMASTPTKAGIRIRADLAEAEGESEESRPLGATPSRSKKVIKPTPNTPTLAPEVLDADEPRCLSDGDEPTPKRGDESDTTNDSDDCEEGRTDENGKRATLKTARSPLRPKGHTSTGESGRRGGKITAYVGASIGWVVVQALALLRGARRGAECIARMLGRSGRE